MPYYNRTQGKEEIEINDQTKLGELILGHVGTCEEDTHSQVYRDLKPNRLLHVHDFF